MLTGCRLAVQYAQWEEGQKDFRRARSVWERALEVSYTNPATWLKCAMLLLDCCSQPAGACGVLSARQH